LIYIYLQNDFLFNLTTMFNSNFPFNLKERISSVELNVKSVFLARKKKRVKCLNFCHVDSLRVKSGSWLLRLRTDKMLSLQAGYRDRKHV